MDISGGYDQVPVARQRQHFVRQAKPWSHHQPRLTKQVFSIKDARRLYKQLLATPPVKLTRTPVNITFGNTTAPFMVRRHSESKVYHLRDLEDIPPDVRATYGRRRLSL